MASFKGHVLDVGLTFLADPQAVQFEEHGERGMRMVEPLRGKEESAQLTSVQSASL